MHKLNWWDEDEDRDWQRADTIYELPDGRAFACPDGEGRYYYDTVEDAAQDIGYGRTEQLYEDEDLRV